jgi:hypothetical protein
MLLLRENGHVERFVFFVRDKKILFLSFELSDGFLCKRKSLKTEDFVSKKQF